MFDLKRWCIKVICLIFFFLGYFWSCVLLLIDLVKDGYFWCENLLVFFMINNRFCYYEIEVWFKKWCFFMLCVVNFLWWIFCFRRRCLVLVLCKNGFEGKWILCFSYIWFGYFSILVIFWVILEFFFCFYVFNLCV